MLTQASRRILSCLAITLTAAAAQSCQDAESAPPPVSSIAQPGLIQEPGAPAGGAAGGSADLVDPPLPIDPSDMGDDLDHSVIEKSDSPGASEDPDYRSSVI